MNQEFPNFEPAPDNQLMWLIIIAVKIGIVKLTEFLLDTLDL